MAEEKAFYKGTSFQNADVRYRDWNILKYWFRAVEE
jgi:capsular polysaccharide phosphotransferase wcwK